MNLRESVSRIGEKRMSLVKLVHGDIFPIFVKRLDTFASLNNKWKHLSVVLENF